MKSSVLITLFIVGLAIIAIPPLFNYLHTQQVVDLLKEGANRVNLGGAVSSEYSFACWVAGAVVILTGIVGAFKTKENQSE